MNRRLKRSTRANPREDRMVMHKHTHTHNIIELSQFNQSLEKVCLVPKNVNQETYIAKLEDPHVNIVFAVGPAGCGKTMLASLVGIQELRAGRVKKIIITRPAVSVDEQHGFLPGTLVDKMQPWVLPILDYFYQYYSKKQVLSMLENDIIEIVPLAYMRGRTFHHCWIIGDEFQNSTPNQMKMLLTRIGMGSKIVVTGDIQQHDRGFELNGLKDIVGRIDNQQALSVCTFDNRDIERHPVIDIVLNIYQQPA